MKTRKRVKDIHYQPFPRTDEEKARQRERIIREANRRRGIR